MKERSGLPKYMLIIIVGFNGMLIFISGIIFAPSTLLIGYFIGFYTYYIVYSIEAKNVLWRELRLIIVILIGSSLGSILLLVTCNFHHSNVCLPNAFRAQIFTNYIAPLISSVGLWFFERLPVLFKGDKNS